MDCLYNVSSKIRRLKYDLNLRYGMMGKCGLGYIIIVQNIILYLCIF